MAEDSKATLVARAIAVDGDTNDQDDRRDGDDRSEPSAVGFRSRLQAKRHERLQQRQQQQQQTVSDEPVDTTTVPLLHTRTTTERDASASNAAAVVGATGGSHDTALQRPHSATSQAHEPGSSRSTTSMRKHSIVSISNNTMNESVRKQSTISNSSAASESNDVDARVRLRGEARRAIISFGGSVWDALRQHDLELVQCFFAAEGAQRLLSRRSPELSDAGRSLLHCAAWLGDAAIARFLLDAGAVVDAIDSAASRTTPLIEAARAGHIDVCVLLLERGADVLHCDAHGDTAFHWAARRGHGSLLVAMALAQIQREGQSASDAVWTSKNLKGKSVLDYVRANPLVLPLLQKRVGGKVLASADTVASAVAAKRRSRFPAKISEKSSTGAPSSRASSGPSSISNGASRLVLSTPPTLDEEQEGGDSDIGVSSSVTVSNRAVASRGSHGPVTPLVSVDALGLDVASFTYKARDGLASR